ncbi:MAG: amidase family protein [Pseudomonadota bacterium]
MSSAFETYHARLAAGERAETIALTALAEARAAPDCFVTLLSEEAVRASARAVEARLAADVDLPLAAVPFCVKDNLDVAGLVTSCNCPGFGALATATAPAIDNAIAAGAILIGKNTMDQFATGLNGTRAPELLCQNALNPKIIPGGLSSGSAVAVARGLCGFALDSDTGGSGRVPAAANGIVGLKPTPGLISGRGMVHCNRSFDVIKPLPCRARRL